jgi:hypothetical protein
MPIEIRGGTITAINDGIDLFRMLALKGLLKLEMKGIKKRGVNAHKLIKQEWKLKGSRAQVLEQFEKLCNEASSKVERINK